MSILASLKGFGAVLTGLFGWIQTRKEDKKTDEFIDAIERSDAAVSDAERILRNKYKDED